MPQDRNRDSEISDESAERIRRGSKRGSKLVSEEFASKLTRRRFCEEVGIHRNTLKRWEAAGVFKPTFEDVLGSKTALYTQDDIERGRAIAELLKANPGEMSLSRAAAIVSKT